MNPIDITKSHYVDHDVSCHFQNEFEKDKFLNIFLTVHKKDEEWNVQARTTIESNGKVIKEVQQNFKVGNGDSRWLGSWEWMFLKPACLNMAGKVEILDEIQSRPDNITPQEIGRLGSHKLLEITGYSEEFMFKSDYLQEISEEPITIATQADEPIVESDAHSNSNAKSQEETKENHL
jgi:hypothetical protein